MESLEKLVGLSLIPIGFAMAGCVGLILGGFAAAEVVKEVKKYYA